MSIKPSYLKNLIKETKKGDVVAFETLYKQHSNYVYKVIFDFFGQRIPEAEDLLQEVFLKAFQNIKTLEKEESFVSWLATITLNVCREYVRNKGFQKNKADIVSIEDYELEEDEKFLPSNVIEEKWTQKTVLNAIESLPNRQRLAMLLFYFNDYSYKDIANNFDITVSGVKKLLYHGRNNLKEPLKQKLDLKDSNYTIGFGFLFIDYGNTLLSESLMPGATVDQGWEQLKEKLPIKKSKMPVIGTSLLIAALLLVGGWMVSFSGEKGKVNEAPPIKQTETYIAPEEPNSIGPDLTEPTPSENGPVKTRLPGIQNTAYVNGEPTNTVALYFEKEDQGGFASSNDYLFGGLPKTGGFLLLVLALLLVGIGTGINIERLKKKRSLNGKRKGRKFMKREKRSIPMKRNLKQRAFATVFAFIMIVSLVYTSLPIEGMAMAPEAETQTEAGLPKPEVEAPTSETPALEPNIPGDLEETKELIDQLLPEPMGITPANQAIEPAGSTTTDGVTFDVSIATTLDENAQPDLLSYSPSESIHLANVDRYDMFYAWLKIDYENQSGVELTNPSITMQMPKLGENTYFEPFSQTYYPAGWSEGNNKPSGAGIEDYFTDDNFDFNETSRLVTWTSSKAIDTNSDATIYIKILMRDPYTKFGEFTYKPQFNYTKGGTGTTIEESAKLNVLGTNDQPSFSMEMLPDLGFVPSEPDANDYYYVKYRLDSDYSYTYSNPPRDYEHDRFVRNVVDVVLDLPVNSQIVSKPQYSTVVGNTLKLDAHRTDQSFLVLRYLKTDFLSPQDIVSTSGVMKGRYISDSTATDIENSQKIYDHEIGEGSSIPPSELGRIVTDKLDFPISEDALKSGSVPFTRGWPWTWRSEDTVRANELVFEYNGAEYLKDGVYVPADYGINMISFASARWTGNLDVNNTMSATVRVYYDDGSFEDLAQLTEAQLIAGNGMIYPGNVPGKSYAFNPPMGKIAKRVVLSVKNPPQGFRVNTTINGYLVGYPSDGANEVKFLRNTYLYGDDPDGSGPLERPEADGSGDTSYTVNIVKDTKFEPQFTVKQSSAGTVNPGGVDTVQLQSYFEEKSKQSFVNPEFDVLLPAGYTYESYTDQTNENWVNDVRVFNLPDGRLKDNAPVIETIPNYNGTGRTLVRIKYTGILQESERLGGLLNIRAAEYISPGTYQVDGYFAAENIGTNNNLSSQFTPYALDVNDMNGNGLVDDYIFGVVSEDLSIVRGQAKKAYTRMQGSFDPALTGNATTKQGTIVDGLLTFEYDGPTAMNNIQLVSILPYEGDGKTLYGDVDDGQRVMLSQAVDASAYPGSTVYYNTTPTNDPNAAGWTTTYSVDAHAVRIDLPPAFEMISGGTEIVNVPIKLQVPGTTDVALLANVQGKGYLSLVGYANIEPDGISGTPSIIESLTLGLNVNVFKDDNANGIKDATENWEPNLDVEVFNITDDVNTATPLYTGQTDANGHVAFLDNFNSVSFGLQGYRVVVHKPSGAYNFVTGVGDVTSDANGQQGVVFNTSNQLVNVLTGFAPQTFSISGNYWQDYEAVPNGMFDAHDLLTATEGRMVKLFNVTDGVYETHEATIAADGSYTIPNVIIGPEYRVEFAYNSATEEPSVLALIGGNMVTEEDTDILGYTFDSSGQAEDSDYTVNAAIVENGTIKVRFSTDGVNTIGTETALTRSLPTTYTANIGTVADTTGHDSGTFVVPTGYRLVASEPTDKSTTIDSTTKTNEIVFLVELLEPNLSGVKTSTPSTADLHPGDTITYTITVTNSGSLEAIDAVVTDQVPASTEFVSADQGGAVDSNGQVKWTIPNLAENGGIQAVSFTVKILPQKDLAQWNVVNDQAKVNDVSTNSTTDPVTQSVLTSGKTSDVGQGQFVDEGDAITYTISTTNTGVIPSDEVTITDTIPEGTTFLEGSMSQGVTIDGKALSITKDSLAPGETLTLTFKVTVNKGAKEINHIENIAKVNKVDTNKVTIPVGKDTPVVGTEKAGILPKTGGYLLLGAAGLLGLLGTGLLVVSRRRKRRQ